MCCFFGGCRNNCRCNCGCNCRCNCRGRDCEGVRDDCEEERRRAFCAGFRAGCNDPRCHCRWGNEDDNCE